MNCRNARENLIELLAGGETNPALAAHVKECADCARELAALRRTMDVLDEWETPEPSPYFLTRLHAHVREEQQKKPQSWLVRLYRPAWALSLAAVLTVGGITVSLLRPRSDTPVPVGTAVSDLENLEKNHDVLLKTDLIEELTGGPSDDVDNSDL